MRVGVIDIGANTLRLLVATPNGAGVTAVHRDRVELGLGEHIEQTGRIPPEKLDLVAAAANEQALIALRLGCERVEIVVTSPGRQASNAGELLVALASVRGATVRVLSADEEGTYAYVGATAGIADLPESVAVCDVGGGSTQLVVGLRLHGPAWARSLDIGSLRLTRRVFESDPPTAKEVACASAAVAPLFAELVPPLPEMALATGGSARALRKLVGRRLGPDELVVALQAATSRSSRRLAKNFDLSTRRARTVAAGTILLASAQRLLGVPLEVASGGLREGVALALLADEAVAA
jgi:exopolyphosphatase/guanosine-5'-triphosphate,3'-diphosphate pyrophosphatase